MRFLGAVRTEQIDRARSPVAYLVTVCHNAAKDSARTLTRVHPGEVPDLDEESTDLTERLLTALDGREAIRIVMERAKADGDHRVNDVVRVWLTLSETEERSITLREIGRHLKMHHQEVQRALQRARRYLEEGQTP